MTHPPTHARTHARTRTHAGIDTMWVTSVDNYQADGVIFKGNVRGKDPASSYAKMKQRLAVRCCAFAECALVCFC
jgi:hypothetical protein